MKKRLVSGLFALLALSPTFAQKLDLDREYWDMRYIQGPQDLSVSALNTYSVAVYGDVNNLNRIGLTSDRIENAVKLNGYVYTPEAGDIEIEVNVESFKIVSESVESRDVASKDQAGNSVNKTLYYAVARYVAPTFIKIMTSADKKVLRDKILANSQNPVVIESASYPTYDGANSFLKGNADKRMENFKARYVEIFNQEFNNFKAQYDYLYKKETEIFWHVDLKKAPEFTEFNEKLESVKEMFFQMKIDDDIKITRDKMAPVLQYWRDNATKTVAEDKKGRKLKYAYLINLARTQLWLDMADECEATSKEIISNDYDELDGKNLLLSVKLLREQIRHTPNNSRHYHREGFSSTTQYKAYDIQPKINPFKYPKPPIGYKAYPGFVINYSKEKIKGQLWAKDLNSSVIFFPKEGTKFVYEENNELKELVIDTKTIDEMSFGREDNFVRMKFKNNAGATEVDAFFKILHESEHYKMLRYYKVNDFPMSLKNTSFSTRLIGSGDICLMKKADGIIVPVGSLIAKNAAENTAGFYDACAEVKNKILAGDFGNMNTIENQIKAITFVENGCK